MVVKKGDTVVMRRGRDRGKQGAILRVETGSGRVLVEGLNVVKKNMRPKRQGEKGQIIDRPSLVPAANVMLICPSCKKPTKIKRDRSNGKLVRICKECGNAV
jgi:large subunit ribosomal protein L24